jgi:hypothetical protein
LLPFWPDRGAAMPLTSACTVEQPGRVLVGNSVFVSCVGVAGKSTGQRSHQIAEGVGLFDDEWSIERGE